MEILKSRCIILTRKELNEADLSATIFSREFGKISGVAYGIRKSRRRNLFSLNPLNIVEITFHKKNNYYTIVESEIIKNFKNIMQDINKLETALYISDSVNKIYDLTYENEVFFDRLEKIFEFINNTDKFGIGYKYFVILTFLRRIMVEQGIYHFNGINERLGIELSHRYREITEIYKGNAENSDFLQEKFEEYLVFLKKIAIIFEKYINENLQVKMEIKKFIMEDL